jgi:hypothetical protein
MVVILVEDLIYLKIIRINPQLNFSCSLSFFFIIFLFLSLGIDIKQFHRPLTAPDTRKHSDYTKTLQKAESAGREDEEEKRKLYIFYISVLANRA